MLVVSRKEPILFFFGLGQLFGKIPKSKGGEKLTAIEGYFKVNTRNLSTVIRYLIFRTNDCRSWRKVSSISAEVGRLLVRINIL